MKPMMGATSPELLYRQLLDADEAGVRLEMVMGQPIWEFHPSPLHQSIIGEVLMTIKAMESDRGGCGCYWLTDAYIAFPDGSFKRPDICIYGEKPPVS
jgi:hypothetical protein